MMISFVRKVAERICQKRDGITKDADNLICDLGVHAYEEARRRRFEANDISSARYWGQVKSEIGRRIMQECGPAAIARIVEANVAVFDTIGCAILNSQSDNRVEAYGLARMIDAVAGDPCPPAPVRKRHADQPPLQAVFGFIEAEAHEVGRLLLPKHDIELETAA